MILPASPVRKGYVHADPTEAGGGLSRLWLLSGPRLSDLRSLLSASTPLLLPLLFMLSLLLGRTPRPAHSLLHGIFKLLQSLSISCVHFLRHTAEVLAGLNDVTVVAMQLVSIAQHLHQTLHALRARRSESHRAPKVLQRTDGFLLVRAEVVGIGIKDSDGVLPLLDAHLEYRFQHCYRVLR